MLRGGLCALARAPEFVFAGARVFQIEATLDRGRLFTNVPNDLSFGYQLMYGVWCLQISSTPL